MTYSIRRLMHLPAPGKTTLAVLMGKVMHALGLLPTDRVVRKSVEELVGVYVGEAYTNVAKAFDEAKGGVLLIDEADILADGGQYCQDVQDRLVERIWSYGIAVRTSISQQPILPTLHALTNAIASIRKR